MRKAFLHKISLAVFALLMLSVGAAYADDTLPWLSGGVGDPFATKEKALAMIDPKLKPAGCRGKPDLTKKLRFNH